MAPYRQSDEIKSLSLAGHAVPVNKERRRGDAEEKATLAGRRKYTWNVDEMVPFARFGKKDDNRCDVCGASCTEVLFGVLHSQFEALMTSSGPRPRLAVRGRGWHTAPAANNRRRKARAGSVHPAREPPSVAACVRQRGAPSRATGVWKGPRGHSIPRRAVSSAVLGAHRMCELPCPSRGGAPLGAEATKLP